MAELDFSFSVVSSKKGFVRALWLYYIYIYAPRIVRSVVMIAFCLITGCMAEELWKSGFFVLAAILLMVMLSEFPVYCHRVVAIVSRLGVFGKENHFRFYSDKFYSRCGDNENTTTYNSFSGYFQFRDILVLTMENGLFSSGFQIDQLGGHLPEFIECLEAAGVKKIKFFTVKRWLLTILSIVLVVYLTLP